MAFATLASTVFAAFRARSRRRGLIIDRLAASLLLYHLGPSLSYIYYTLHSDPFRLQPMTLSAATRGGNGPRQPKSILPGNHVAHWVSWAEPQNHMASIK